MTWRGPHGGRIPVLASVQGRAGADQIERAARLAHVDVDTFLTGPAANPPARGAHDRLTEVAEAHPAPAAPPARSAPAPVRAPRNAGDSVVALVLTTHARHDRPMRFGEIVDLCGGRVTRTQVSEASAHLCRTGQLDRICDGVYQWAHGTRRQDPTGTIRPPAAAPQISGPASGRSPAPVEPVDELFARLFPHGVRMTPALLRDVQRWADLTRTLAAHADTTDSRRAGG